MLISSRKYTATVKFYKNDDWRKLKRPRAFKTATISFYGGRSGDKNMAIEYFHKQLKWYMDVFQMDEKEYKIRLGNIFHHTTECVNEDSPFNELLNKFNKKT